MITKRWDQKTFGLSPPNCGAVKDSKLKGAPFKAKRLFGQTNHGCPNQVLMLN